MGSEPPPWERDPSQARSWLRLPPGLRRRAPAEIKTPNFTVEKSGLVVVREELTPEQKKERRQDNKEMKEIHSKVRRRKRHGRR